MKAIILRIAFCVALLLLSLPAKAAAQTDITSVTQNAVVQWGYTDAMLVAGAGDGKPVTKFRVCIDSTNVNSCGVVGTSSPIASTNPDFNLERPYESTLPTLSLGEHRVDVYACTAGDICSAPASVKINIMVVPQSVLNLKLSVKTIK